MTAANTLLVLYQDSKLKEHTMLQNTPPWLPPQPPGYAQAVLEMPHWAVTAGDKEQQQPGQQGLLPCRMDTYTELSFDTA